MARKSDSMKLVEDEFDEESLSDGDEKVELHKLKITKAKSGLMGGCGQVVLFLMFWFVMMGICMLTMHIVARSDPHRQTLMIIAVSCAWIGLANIFAVAVFIIDKYQSFNKQPRLSEALVHTQFALGGVVGGWLALCMTCYRPPGIKNDRIAGFICRGMFCSAIGVTLIVVTIVRVVVPNIQMMFG
ncbi:uncharacterized protein LOC100178566 [Ciona intestinalis]